MKHIIRFIHFNGKHTYCNYNYLLKLEVLKYHTKIERYYLMTVVYDINNGRMTLNYSASIIIISSFF